MRRAVCVEAAFGRFELRLQLRQLRIHEADQLVGRFRLALRVLREVCIADRIQHAAVVRGIGAVERHADHFAHDTPDEVWLAEVGRRGWIALTHDKRIRYKPNERDAVMRHRVGLLVIVGVAPFAELARAFVATLPSIEHFLDNHAPPFIAKVYRPSRGDTAERADALGRVELWYPR